jgi:hypothetical protein
MNPCDDVRVLLSSRAFIVPLMDFGRDTGFVVYLSEEWNASGFDGLDVFLRHCHGVRTRCDGASFKIEQGLEGIGGSIFN